MNELQKIVFSHLMRKQTPVEIKISLSRKKKAKIKGIIPESKLIILNSGERIPITSINYIRVFGKRAEEFSRFIKQLTAIEVDESISHFLNKRAFIYPHGEKEYYGSILGFFPYITIIKIGSIIEIKFQIYISALSFFKPYKFINGSPENNPVSPGSWREEWKELRKLLKESIPRKIGKTITLALRDGREITGFLFRKDIFRDKWKLRLRAPENEENFSPTIFVMKHAIEDFWEEE